MTVTPYPFPRSFRESEVLNGTGVSTYGPFGFKIFDPVDVKVYVKPDDQDLFEEAPAIVTKVSNQPFDDFTVTFPADLPPSTRFIVRSERLHERQIAVTKGGAISTDQLEKELSKQGTVLDELRRDLDQTVRTDYGGGGMRIQPIPAGHFWKSDGEGNAVDGGSAADIGNAQEYAEEAKADADRAQQAVQEAEPAAAAAIAAAIAAEQALSSAGLPNPALPSTFLFRNEDNTAYEAKTAEEARAILGLSSEVAVVADDAELSALDPVETKFAVTIGEGAKNGHWNVMAGAPPVTDTLRGIYRTSNTPGWYWVRRGDWAATGADVRWWGAALDDATDDTAAFNAALAVAKTVFFPAGRAYITDMIQVPNNGQLIGEGVLRSIFSLKADFNLGAQAVVKMGTSENMSLIDKIGFEFFQPASAVREDMIQYPFAVGHRNIPRARIGHIRIMRGWNGIDASQNGGGATYDWVECGTLNIGLWIDGALDTVNIGRFRHWPFGMAANVNAGVVYRDGNNRAAVIGRCDGLSGEIQTFRGYIHFPAGGGSSSANRQLDVVHLDGDGARLQVDAGPLDIGFCYSTKSANDGAASSIVVQAGANVRIENLTLDSDKNGIPILVNNGTLQVNGGRINHIRTSTRAAYLQNGGAMIFRNVEMTAPGARTETYLRGDAGELIVQNCWFPANGGTGTAIARLGSAVLTNSGNVLNGRTVTT
jgi:hypothetical protein